MVFVAHRVAGVHRVPDEWLDGLLPSGFRLATAAEIAAWHEERGLEPPADVAEEHGGGDLDTGNAAGAYGGGAAVPPLHYAGQ